VGGWGGGGGGWQASNTLNLVYKKLTPLKPKCLGIYLLD
jgi:hypothetical protein